MTRDMIAEQIGEMQRGTDLLDLLLGYHSVLGRVKSAATRPGRDTGDAADDPLAYAILGLLSLETHAARFVRHALAETALSDTVAEDAGHLRGTRDDWDGDGGILR